METSETKFKGKLKPDSDNKKLLKKINQVIISKKMKLYSKDNANYNVYIKRIFQRFNDVKKEASYKKYLTAQEMMLNFLDLVITSTQIKEEGKKYFNTK